MKRNHNEKVNLINSNTSELSELLKRFVFKYPQETEDLKKFCRGALYEIKSKELKHQ